MVFSIGESITLQYNSFAHAEGTYGGRRPRRTRAKKCASKPYGQSLQVRLVRKREPFFSPHATPSLAFFFLGNMTVFCGNYPSLLFFWRKTRAKGKGYSTLPESHARTDKRSHFLSLASQLR